MTVAPYDGSPIYPFFVFGGPTLWVRPLLLLPNLQALQKGFLWPERFATAVVWCRKKELRNSGWVCVQK